MTDSLAEDIAVDPFVHSSFGTVIMALFQGLFTVPSWHTFTALACGWALATDRHTITTYMWLTGYVAHWGDRRQALFTLLCVPWLPPLPATLAPLGGGHPPGGPGCPRGRSHSRQLRRYDQEKSWSPYRRARPLPQWRGLSPTRIPYVAGLELRLGRDAPAAQALARPQPQHSGRPRTLS